MIGTILGDCIGQPYEFINFKSKEFPLLPDKPIFTDDTLMSLAVAKALLETGLSGDEERIMPAVVKEMQSLGRKYPSIGFGGMFFEWLFLDRPFPYNSYGNGSAMRVSPVGFLYSNRSLQTCRKIAKATAVVTHNHPEGIKGAEATASAIWLSLNKKSKKEIKDYIETEFGYDLNRRVDDIRPDYRFYVSCQKSVPEAIICFLEGKDFEDTVRNCVSLGGDTDTQAAIAGGIAEAYFSVPDSLSSRIYDILIYDDLIKIYNDFEETYKKVRKEN